MLEIKLSTLLLQIANFLIMALILTRFLFKPLREVLDKRAAHATKAMDEGEEAKREAEALRTEYEKRLENIEAEFAALKNEARVVIDETRQQMLREAYDEIDAMRARAKEEIDQQRTDALRLHRGKIGDVVATLVQRMMKDVLNPQLHEAYLGTFLEQLRSVQMEGQVATDGEDGFAAELITATSLTQPDQEEIAATLEEALSQPVDLIYRVDPELVAGAMIRLGDMLIDGSLQGQIQQLRNRYEDEVG
jgi:F-type H+-transporting ATPase subunit b